MIPPRRLSMTKILILLILFIPSICFSATRGVPFLIEADQRFSDLETLSGLEIPSAEILVGNASGDGAAVAMSGDTTISNAGVVAIGTDKIVNSMMADNSVDSDEYVDGSLDDIGRDGCTMHEPFGANEYVAAGVRYVDIFRVFLVCDCIQRIENQCMGFEVSCIELDIVNRVLRHAVVAVF